MKYVPILLILLAGCTPSLKVVELSATADGLLTSGRLGGCRVETPDKIPAGLTFEYRGEKCTVKYGVEE